ncbi:hypothetical protein [Paenibacillus popilliae]|uniref:Small-conductance mechanosensitive channel n=1 Tax=Paenibacillus popilliae ATCC 14706 TaxID=1212764 RepID=M9M5G6_PAEPP|nr:hypothetical protein [Paenibacillus popilliae]GAC42583.1 small-conductance mechanosensitive channel [Paenibacillus popilliae ATCC 14706]
MKKTILSLTAVLSIFASVSPIYAAPVADSASKVSVNEFVSTEPTVDIIYQSKVPDNGAYIYDGTYPMPEIFLSSLKPGEHKIVRYVKLHQGEKLTIFFGGYSMTLADGSRTNFSEENKIIEKIADKDGIYSVEFSLPKVPDLDVKKYHILGELAI